MLAAEVIKTVVVAKPAGEWTLIFYLGSMHWLYHCAKPARFMCHRMVYWRFLWLDRYHYKYDDCNSEFIIENAFLNSEWRLWTHLPLLAAVSVGHSLLQLIEAISSATSSNAALVLVGEWGRGTQWRRLAWWKDVWCAEVEWIMFSRLSSTIVEMWKYQYECTLWIVVSSDW